VSAVHNEAGTGLQLLIAATVVLELRYMGKGTSVFNRQRGAGWGSGISTNFH